MCCEITKNKAIVVTSAETAVLGALTTGAIIGAIVAGTTLATVALSVGAAVAGMLTLISLLNHIGCYFSDEKEFGAQEKQLNWLKTHICVLVAYDHYSHLLF